MPHPFYSKKSVSLLCSLSWLLKGLELLLPFCCCGISYVQDNSERPTIFDGRPDLVAIKKSNTGTNSTEVHILSGGSNFQQFILQTGTALHPTDQTFDFAMTDWDGDGRPDLVAIKKSNTGTNSTEVHILSWRWVGTIVNWSWSTLLFIPVIPSNNRW